MAVVAIFALLAGILAPRVGSVTGRDLTQSAARISTRIDQARQRAALTGINHRLLVDIDAGAYRVEWRVSEAQQMGLPPEPPEELDLRGEAPIPMTPRKSSGEADYRVLPGVAGRFEYVESSVFITGIETSAGYQDHGEAEIEFDFDGTASDTSLYLEDESGRTLALDVLPLADGVRIREEAG